MASFKDVYEIAKSAGRSAKEAYLYALKYADPEPEAPPSGKKSFSISGSNLGANVIDVPFGNSGMDVEAMFGGYQLNPEKWKEPPQKELKGDINHFNFDMAEGVYNDLDEKWQNFITKASDFYSTKNEDGEYELRGKVYVPNTELGKEFLQRYENGELGVSVEYKPKKWSGNFIEDWDITGYSFHEDPSYNTKKPKDL